MWTPDLVRIRAQLPDWARADVQMRAQHGPVDDAPWVIINCDADAMYPAWLAELRASYRSTKLPRAWYENGGVNLKPEWGVCLAELDRTPVTAYWLEVVYQCAKMELQGIVGRLQFEMRMNGGRQKYGQKTAPQGRPTAYAAGSYTIDGKNQLAGTEAREHFRRLRGFVPG